MVRFSRHQTARVQPLAGGIGYTTRVARRESLFPSARIERSVPVPPQRAGHALLGQFLVYQIPVDWAGCGGEETTCVCELDAVSKKQY